MQSLKLYASPFGGSAIIEAALTLCGLEYQNIDEDFEKLDECEPLKAINPLCQIPTLVLPDGAVMSESAAIVLYLGAQYPGAGLVPREETAAYREFLRWLIFLVANVYPTFTYGDFPQRWVSGKAAQDELVAATNARRKAHWRTLETVASDASWFLDCGFTAIDLYIWVMSHWQPRRAWFRRECPGLLTIAEALDADARLQSVDARNFAGRK